MFLAMKIKSTLFIFQKYLTPKLLIYLLITQADKSHYVFIKDFNHLMFSRTKDKYKKHHCMRCLQSFTKEEILDQYKKQCLLINGTQPVNYESGIIKFKNYEKQVPIIFKIYADTECFLERTNFYEGEHTTKYQKHISNSIGAKFVCIGDRLTLPFIIFKGDDCINEFIKWVFRQKEWIKQVIYQHFNKELIMTNEEIYNNSFICRICKEKLDSDKMRDYSTVTGKFRGASHSKSSINLRIPKKLPIIFHNLQEYDGHIIFKELNNFNVDIEVIPKGIDKYMSIIINRNITFIDSLQF